jgi:hypothetical protein
LSADIHQDQSELATTDRIDWASARLHGCRLPDAARINRLLDDAIRRLRDPDYRHRSHFVGGRFENLYVDPDRIQGIESVLESALGCAGRILERPVDGLRCGYWLNLTGPGQATSEHTHDEDDELLSAVYYVTVPEGSGDLLLYDGPARIAITPEAGTFLFFPPTLPHAVACNTSDALRISIGINIGPA